MSQPQPESGDAAPSTLQPLKHKRQINFVLAFQLAIVVVLSFLIGERFTSLFHGASSTIGAL